MEEIQGDAGIDCPCGGRMLQKSFTFNDDVYPVRVECPRCGKTPLDLLIVQTVVDIGEEIGRTVHPGNHQ